MEQSALADARLARHGDEPSAAGGGFAAAAPQHLQFLDPTPEHAQARAVGAVEQTADS